MAIPIVCIGASAGGLKEIEHFFKQIKNTNKAAFVIIQHLAPDHKSILAEIVNRYTEMDAYQIEHGMEVEAGKVYIIPPNRTIHLSKNKFLLVKMQRQQGRQLPIDIFLRSFKDELKEKAIAVILSGTGTDGTLGIKEVKEAGGLTIVQDPETAEYDGMPRNAMNTRLIDFCIQVEKMPEVILNYVDNNFSSKC
jgi:two-component system CheB/CheR fusion protein